ELSAEGQEGQHLFEATLSLVDRGRALYTGVPFYTDHDFNLHELEQAQQVAIRRLEEGPNRKFSRLEGPSQLSCERTGGFLSPIPELFDDHVQGLPTPVPLCYGFKPPPYPRSLDQ